MASGLERRPLCSEPINLKNFSFLCLLSMHACMASGLVRAAISPIDSTFSGRLERSKNATRLNVSLANWPFYEHVLRMCSKKERGKGLFFTARA